MKLPSISPSGSRPCRIGAAGKVGRRIADRQRAAAAGVGRGHAEVLVQLAAATGRAQRLVVTEQQQLDYLKDANAEIELRFRQHQQRTDALRAKLMRNDR